MSCLSEATILGWLDNRLSPAERTAAQNHSFSCADCLELVAAARAARSTYHGQSATTDTLMGELGSDTQAVAPDLRYQIGSQIGSGGMGQVFEATDIALGRSVAIKMVRDPTPELVARFRGEVAIASMLQHPAIIPVYDAGTFSDGSAFCAMRLVKGNSLESEIASNPTLNERMSLLPSVIQVANAIAYAHSKQILHRDLKPQNILIGEFGETIVLDWGLSKKLGGDEINSGVIGGSEELGMTQHGQVLGTPGYMAPEQEQGLSVDTRSDVFALGVILKQLLSGMSPTKWDSAPLRKVPKDLAAIATRATESAPDKRYASAQEFADDLNRFRTGQLVKAQKYSVQSLALRWASHNKGIIATAALISALLVGAVISGSLIADSAREEEAARQGELSQIADEKHQQELEEQQKRQAEEKAKPDFMESMLMLANGTTKEDEVKMYRDSKSKNEKLLEQNPSDIPQQRKLARSYEKIGISLLDVLIGSGDTTGAHREFQNALAIRRRLTIDNPGQATLERELAAIHKRIGDLYHSQYQLESSIDSYQASMEANARSLKEDGRQVAIHRFLDAKKTLASVLSESGDYRASLELFQSGLATENRILAKAPEDSKQQWRVSIAHGRVADVFLMMKKPAAAMRSYKAAIAMTDSDGYKDPKWRSATAFHYLRLGRLLQEKGKRSDARRAFSQCEALYSNLSASTFAYESARCSALAGHPDKAFEAMENLLARSSDKSINFENQPDFATLRSDKRWHWLLARMAKRK